MPMLGLTSWRKRGGVRALRNRLKIDIADRPVYVVGDVHGCLDALVDIEGRIEADLRMNGFGGDGLIVMLGDYVDRGPSSAQVIDHLLGAAPGGLERICLAGNHEVAFLDYLDGRLDLDSWLGLGAGATIKSYNPNGRAAAKRSVREDAWRETVPGAHVEFLRSLPVVVDAGTVILVHAGLKPGIPLKDNSDDDLVWTRPDGPMTDLPGWVIHGHTPVPAVQRLGRAINIDTGAVFYGRLSAVRIWKNKLKVFSNRD